MKKVCANPGISEGGRWSRVQNEINQCKAFCFRSPRGGEGGPRPAPLPPVSIGGLGEGGQRGGFSKGAAPKNRLKYLKNRPFGRAAALVVPTVPWACSRATFVATFRGPGKRCRPSSHLESEEIRRRTQNESPSRQNGSRATILDAISSFRDKWKP